VVNLGLILLGSTLAAIAAHRQWITDSTAGALGATSAAVLATAGIIQTRQLTVQRVADRMVARSASEAYKAVVYRFLAAGAADPDRAGELDQAVDRIETLTADQAVLVIGVEPDDQAVPEVGGITDYRDQRADRQRAWHARGSAKHRQLAQRWRAAELAATVVAAILAVAGEAWNGASLSAWTAVATTAAAAFAAYLAGQQDDRIAQSYARTAQSLESLLRDFDPATATADEAARFVAGVETVLADQNETWTSLFKA